MPIPFTCPHCGAQTQVLEEFAGRSGPCGQCGEPITVPPLGAPPAYAAPAQTSGKTSSVIWAVLLPVFLVVGIVVILILAALLLPAIQAAREAARRASCTNNLKQIGVAMHNYHAANGCFPPAYIPDENGRPKHSWRVLLLPYMDKQPLYDRYDFDEPWDSPNNFALAQMMPSFYRCPSDFSTDGSDTSYAMVVGPGTISDGPTATKDGDIRDGLSNTIMVVEVAGSGINWLDPSDYHIGDVGFEINAFQVNGFAEEGIRSEHPLGANVLFCDGSVRRIRESVDPEVLEAATTIAGGDDTTGLRIDY